jgi:hypothetical protein
LTQILKLSLKQCIIAPQKNELKKQNKIFAEGHASGPRQRLFGKKIDRKTDWKKSLPRAWHMTLGKKI